MVGRKSDKSGRSLERLVAALERALTDSNATIESPSRRLIDQDTKKAREHDVLITWNHGHHQITTAIECRDRSRPVGVPDVEAFADKCRSTGVNSGVLVSSNGFSNSARTKAQARSIICMDLSEVAGFDWLGTPAIVGFERRFGDFKFDLFFDKNPETLAFLRDCNGTTVTKEQLPQTLMNAIPLTDDFESQVDKVIPLNVHMNTLNWVAVDEYGIEWPIDHIKAKTSFTIIRTVHDFSAHTYAGGGKEYSVASADVRLGDVTGKFMIVRNEDDSMSVVWTGGES
jgi:Restriction endonuclease